MTTMFVDDISGVGGAGNLVFFFDMPPISSWKGGLKRLPTGSLGFSAKAISTSCHFIKLYVLMLPKWDIGGQ